MGSSRVLSQLSSLRMICKLLASASSGAHVSIDLVGWQQYFVTGKHCISQSPAMLLFSMGCVETSNLILPKCSANPNTANPIWKWEFANRAVPHYVYGALKPYKKGRKFAHERLQMGLKIELAKWGHRGCFCNCHHLG